MFYADHFNISGYFLVCWYLDKNCENLYAMKINKFHNLLNCEKNEL